MKIGKVSQTVLKRSMLKPLQYKRDEAMFAPSVEEMCYGVTCKEDEEVLHTSVVLYGDEKDLGVFALAQAVNNLASRGARMVGMDVHIMLPPHAYESRLKSMIEHIESAGSAHRVQVLSAKAEVSPIINKAMISLHGVGILKRGKLLQSHMGKPGQDIVLLKWIGLEGTLRVMREKQAELEKRFVHTFLNKLNTMEGQLFSEEAIGLAVQHGASAIHQITEGGILAALWEVAEASDVGVEVELKQMSIRQETVEICEFCHMNPYQLTSAGSLLVITDSGEELVQKCEDAGVQAVVLGRTTADNARVILSGEERRFLDRPATDELWKLYSAEL